MTTLRDALSEALGKSEEGTLQAPIETPIETDAPEQGAIGSESQEQREARARDEQGRFTARQQAAAQAQTEVPAAATAPEPRKPPSSWKKDYWDHWGKLDPSVQGYIEQREADYAKGVSTYKGQWDQAAPLVEAMQPFMPELQQYGIQPAQWIANLGNAHRTLALGSPEQKLQMFAKLAVEYGVPLQGLQTGQVDPQASHVMQTVSSLQREVEGFKQAQRASQQALLQREIETFKQNAPHFEEVKETMARLLQSGVAPDLKTAYDKAIRLHDDIWQQRQAEQARAAEAASQAQIAKKKAAAVSPRSSGPTGAAASGGNTRKGLRDQLSEAFDSASSGRF